MKPVLTVDGVRRVDAAAEAAGTPRPVLVGRAGHAVAASALRMLGGAYGRRVVVLAGKGSNGDDGRVAAAALARRGARVEVIDALAAPPQIGPADLVIDAALGIGVDRPHRPPRVPEGSLVLAVDLPSGVDGDTGEVHGAALAAERTVTFAALKPGLLWAAGPVFAGEVEVAPIGLDDEAWEHAAMFVVDDADVAAKLPRRARDAHKWGSAVAVVAGSPGMLGAAELTARAAQRAGAGMVRLLLPGIAEAALPAGDAVAASLPAEGWASAALDHAERVGAIAIGPGLGRSPAAAEGVLEVLGRAEVPVVVDGDALTLLAAAGERGRRALADRAAPTILTPHGGEAERLAGEPVGARRWEWAQELAERWGATVLLKGPATVVAAPGDDVPLVVTSGGPSLATAGTGDVLTGVIAALLASGLDDARWAAATGAHLHGRAASLGPTVGLVASDLPELLPAAAAACAAGSGSAQ